MNVCIFSSTLDKKGGGPSRSVPILAKGLCENGVNTILVTFQSADMNLHILEGTNISLVILPKTASEGDIKQIFIDNKVDIIHSQGIWLPVYSRVCKLAKQLGIPYIMTPRGALEPWCLKSGNIWKRFKKAVAMKLYQKKDLQRASCILATAPMEANNLRLLGLSAPISIIPNGLVFDDYACRTPESITKCKRQMIFLSRIVHKKGIELLLEAWKQVYPSHNEWNLIIVGNGAEDYISRLNAKISEFGLSSSVSILPPAFGDEKYRLYTESSVFILPTYSENFGMVIAEALSCGLPVITTTGTPWESLVRAGAGWWIELSEENLVNTLREAMNMSASQLFEMGQRGSRMVRDNYDYLSIASRMCEVYSWVLGKAEKPMFVV